MALHEEDALVRSLNLQGPGNQLDDFSFDSFEVNILEDPFHGLDQADSFYGSMLTEAEAALFRMPDTFRGRENSDQGNNNQKRVRFEETLIRESSSDTSEDPEDSFPDLFEAADHPRVVEHMRALKEIDASGLQQSEAADNESCYDFDGDAERLAFEVDEESDSEEEGSGYDCK